MFHHVKRMLVNLAIKICSMFTSTEPCIIANYNNYHIALPKPKQQCTLEYKVYLEYEGMKRIDITQPPGTMYHYHPNDFGALYYVLVSTETGKEVIMSDRIYPNTSFKRRAITE